MRRLDRQPHDNDSVWTPYIGAGCVLLIVGLVRLAQELVDVFWIWF